VAAIAQVEPLTSTRALVGPFDYALPEELRANVRVGSLLVVPFGSQDLLGVVVGLADRSELAHERLRAPRSAVEANLPAELVELAGWIAGEYCSTRARALGLLLPPGAAGGSQELMRIIAQLSPAGEAARAGDGVRLTPGQRALLESLGRSGPVQASALGANHSALKRLEARGLVELDARAVRRTPVHAPVGARRDAVVLNSAQAAAVAEARAAIAARAHARLLLFGVTGSGKTEVYLRAAAAALELGRGVIVLVPEIGLTPQTVTRFVERFGDTVAVLHSRLSAGERHDEWLRLHRGEARICVGPRSAVFAPIENLGLIVVDEEHDSSYKHEGDPRYDARHVAAHRARVAGALLLAGSATPRAESFAALRALRLPSRADGGAMPTVEVVDMRDTRTAMHERTAQALGELRRGGGKAIILLNRRGWSNFLSCRHCGKVWGCPECDVALVLHQAERAIACHHCGHRERVPELCDSCGSSSVARHGLGTERLEHELAQALGGDDFPIFRLDADVATLRGKAAGLLRRFDEAATGVLLGTQMVAKGHDFDGVGLGVVLDADAALRFPDFRSEERTFALLAQLAGRTGRGAQTGGRVLVQTLAPDARAIAFAARHDSDGFLAGELERRRTLGYPPYGELIRIVCAAEGEGAAMRAAEELRRRLVIESGQILGPAPLFRLRGKDRAQILIKAVDRAAAVAAVGAAVATPVGRDVALSVDVDPQ
jgi:primosomal protein N' (replication factor Y) (superfamily II helicase)